ncbi:MAG: hypothetical protein OEZ37_05895, partial [Gemmatimonadota bacterium]|nr:hypothetical protein [Gemmatimonadota bacterium]
MSRLSTIAYLPCLAAALCSTACGSRERMTGEGWGVEEHGGATVVTNYTPAWEDGEGWTVGVEPALEITLGGEGLHAVADARRLRDGRIVVADAAAGEIHVFSSGGDLLARMGGVGDGAGVFRQLTSVWEGGPDTLLAFDGVGRVSRFTSSGRFVDAVTLSRPGDLVWAELAPASSGTLLGTTGWTTGDLGPGAEGVIRPPMAVLAVDPLTPAVDTLFTLAGTEFYVARLGATGAFTVSIPPLSLVTVARARGDDVVVGTGEVMGYEIRARDGAVRSRVRIEGYDLSGAERLWREIRDDQLSHAAGTPYADVMASIIDGMPVPEFRPALADIRVDPDGNVWLARHRGP